MSRYLVGIDLGTTNTVVAYADRDAQGADIERFDIEQLVALGEIAARPTLPSFRYQPARGELKQSDIRLPWGESETVVGRLAQELGAQAPGRLVASAKSWLSHRGVDRTAAILPWGAEDVPKVSPVEASAGYLAHLRCAWNRRFPDYPLEQQEVVLTVPASFDEAARALTVAAAEAAGLSGFRLVEEPQAAFYDWLYRHREKLDSALNGVHLALVCDVGGGTTDLTLIRVMPGEPEPELVRIAVGDHLMLGGDNIDLALAHVAESRLATGGTRLDAARFSQLVQQCRRAKEQLLAPDAPETAQVTVLGAGAKVVGGARSVNLTRDEVARMVVDGFFPRAEPDERPQRTRGGLVEFGLPYVSDPAVTRHVAAFLEFHGRAAREALGALAPPSGQLAVPDAVLLNGGVFHSATLSERLLETLGSWRGQPLRLLESVAPELAVARGAVAYGLGRGGGAPRIGGGSGRSYFLDLGGEGVRQGVCVLPRGTEEGKEVRLTQRTFALRLKQPVRFHLLSSTGDTDYEPGELVDLSQDDFAPLPPVATVLEADRRGEIPVELTTRLTEVGTLDLYCLSADDPATRWRLAFQLRETQEGGGEPSGSLGELHPQFDQAASHIEKLYGPPSRGVDPKAIKRLRSDLEKILGPRGEWDPVLLRELFEVLWEGAGRRRRSVDHERVWFNLSGYCLRPGFGHPLDDWRLDQAWPLFEKGLQHIKESQVWSEWWIFWRRLAGGLSGKAQEEVIDEIAWHLQPQRLQGKRPPGPKRLAYDDMVRLAGSLERVAIERKVEIGGWLLERSQKASEGPQSLWALGRIGARQPFYASAHMVVPRAVAVDWLEQLMRRDWRGDSAAAFAAAQIARCTGDRERDLEPQLRERVAARLEAARASPAWSRMVREVSDLNETDQSRTFGESLPPGLRLLSQP